MILISSNKMSDYSNSTLNFIFSSRYRSKFSSNFTLVFALATVLVLCVAGCQSPTPPDPYAPQVITNAIVQHTIVGMSVENRPIEMLILGNGDDVTFILATIHGNEPAGTPLVERLSEYLMQNRYLLDNRKVIIVPVANPDGLAHKTAASL